jgi:hypothetical protein
MFYLYRLISLVACQHVVAGTNINTTAGSKILRDPRTPFVRLEDVSLSTEISWPVLQSSFDTPPDCGQSSYYGARRLEGRRALITGGDSGPGRAHVAINYLPEEEGDAQALSDFLSKEGRMVERIPGDLINETFCADLVHESNEKLGGLDLIVNNAGYAFSVLDVSGADSITVTALLVPCLDLTSDQFRIFHLRNWIVCSVQMCTLIYTSLALRCRFFHQGLRSSTPLPSSQAKLR